VLCRLACENRERAARTRELGTPLAPLVSEARMRSDRLVEPLRSRQVCHANPQMVDEPADTERVVVHGLGAVAVRVEQEGAVVVRAVLGTRPRRAVVPVTGSGADTPELVDTIWRGRDEPDVEPPRRGPLRSRLRQREVVPLVEVLVGSRPGNAERTQKGLVEPLRALAIGDADRHVVED